MGDRAKRNRRGEVVEFLGVSDYDAKTNAALHIDEIVKVSKFTRRAADYNSRHDADNFSYRTAYFMDYDGKYYKLEVSVKEHMGDKTVYNIGNIEKRSSPLNGSSQINGRSGTSRDNADALRRTSTADTISQNEDNVNSQSMQDGVKYSLAYTTENEPVVVIEEDILAGKEPSEWVKTVKDTIRDKFSSGIPVSGRLVKVNRKTRNEYVNSEYTKTIRRSSPIIYEDKFRSANHLDEIILASTNYINEDLKHERSDSFREFARGDVLMRVDGRDYSARVIIGFTSRGEMVLYDIVNFKKADFDIKKKGASVNTVSQSVRNDRQNAPSDDTISQNEDNVNTYDMQISEKYSLDAMDKTEALLEQYGALPEGEREGSAAGREVRVPRRTAKDNRTRRTVRTVMEAAVTSDEIAGDLKEKIEAGEFSYMPTSNRTLLDNAETLVKEKGFEAVLSEWRAHVESTREANDRMLGVGEYLLIHALKTKDANLAGTLAVELSVEATAAGRSVSAVRMIKRLGPAAKVYEVMRTVEKLSETTIEKKNSRKAVEEYLRGLSLRAAQKKALWGTLYDSESPWGKGTAFAVPFFVV